MDKSFYTFVFKSAYLLLKLKEIFINNNYNTKTIRGDQHKITGLNNRRPTQMPDPFTFVITFVTFLD